MARERVVHRAIDTSGRVLPHDLDAEAAVLGAILLRPELLSELVAIAPASAYYAPANERVLSAMVDVADKGEPVDLRTVGSWLRDRGQLEAVGGIAYLAKLFDATPSVANAAAHARIVAKLARTRRIAEAGAVVHGEAYAFKGDPDDFAEMAAREMGKALDRVEDNELEALSEVTARRAKELEAQWAGEREPTGMLTGFSRYDEITGGWKLGHLHVVAAYTGGGKSAFSLQAALNLAGTEYQGERVGVVIISAEVPKEEIFDRAVCCLAGVTDQELQGGKFTPRQADEVMAAWQRLHTLPLMIFDNAASVHDVRSLVDRAQREFDKRGDPEKPRIRVMLVVVDYLQIMDLGEADRHDLAIGHFTRSMKRTALEKKAHVVCISQFNRDAPKRGGRPSVFDLSGSGSIENDSNLITLIHRPSISMPAESPEAKAWEEYAELIVGKNRGRGKGHHRVAFRGRHFRFEEPTQTDLENWRRAGELSRDAVKPAKRPS